MNHILNRFLGNSGPGEQAVADRSGTVRRLVDAVPGGVGGLAAGGIASLLIAGRGARNVTGRVGGYGGAAALGALAFKAYDNWKHQANEITEMSAESNFHRHGLDQSMLDQQAFELAVVKVMVAAAKSDGHIDAAEQRRIRVAMDSMQVDTTTRNLVLEWLLRDLSLDEIDADGMALALKTEVYLAACLVVGELCGAERGFLKRLARHLALPAELACQIEMQATQRLPRAA